MIPFCHYQHTDCITSQVQSLNCCTIHHSCSPAFFSSSIFASLFSSGALPSPVSSSFCSEDDCVNSDNHDVTNERALLIAPPKKKNKESKYRNFLNSFDVFPSSGSCLPLIPQGQQGENSGNKFVQSLTSRGSKNKYLSYLQLCQFPPQHDQSYGLFLSA